MDRYGAQDQIKGRYNQNKVDSDRLNVNSEQSRSRSTGQTVSHMWRNSNNPLLPEVCADVVRKSNESSTTKRFNSENKTPPKKKNVISVELPCSCW